LKSVFIKMIGHSLIPHPNPVPEGDGLSFSVKLCVPDSSR
jgi:hypothetical protein